MYLYVILQKFISILDFQESPLCVSVLKLIFFLTGVQRLNNFLHTVTIILIEYIQPFRATMDTVINSTQNNDIYRYSSLSRYRENWDVVVTNEFHRV